MNRNMRTSRHVLIVDDDPALRSVLERALASAGYTVTCAGDGAQALERLDTKRFDLVLIDVWMPRMTGLEVLARLKGAAGSPKAILMTGDHTPETVLAAIREQAWQYIPKPFTPSTVVDMIDKALESTVETHAIEVLSASPDWVELSVPCERTAAERVQDFLMHLTDLPEDVRDEVGHVFRELLVNAVEWGGGLDPTRRVRIAFLRGKRFLLYRIADPGKGFRMEEMAHAALSNPANDPISHFGKREQLGLRAGGFGILIARAMADELLYNEAHNEVVFMKYLE